MTETRMTIVAGLVLAMTALPGQGLDRPGQSSTAPSDDARRGGPLMRALDADGDGELSAAEIAAAPAALKKLDRNGDGKLSGEELHRPERDLPVRGVVATGAKVVEAGSGFRFTEGPAADAAGNVLFTDIPANRIHKWSTDGKLSVFRTDTRGANGLAFDARGNLLACEGDAHRVVSIDANGRVTVLADRYGGKPLNCPNDLWVDPKGGVYFSDPLYGRAKTTQDGEHVYYVTPDRKKVLRVIDDMVRPNGLVGTPDGKVLYVADHGAGKTYRYTIRADGTLSDKKPFASRGSDGMTLDSEGNVYLTDDGVVVYDAAGRQIEKIDLPRRPTNVCFGGADGRTVFITARQSIYTVRMRVPGASRGKAR